MSRPTEEKKQSNSQVLKAKELINYLGGGFEYFLCSPLPVELIQFDYYVFFQVGWNHQLVSYNPLKTEGTFPHLPVPYIFGSPRVGSRSLIFFSTSRGGFLVRV